MSVTSVSSGGTRYQALIQLLRTADALWSASQQFFSQWELSPSQFNVINLLADQSTGLSQSDLSRLMITHRSNVTGLINRLEEKNLVMRTDAAGDRRAYRVVLTNSGRRLLQQILPEFHIMADSVWDGTPADRARQLADDLEKLGVNARRISKRKDG